MKRHLSLLGVIVLATSVGAAQSAEPVDLAAIAKIRAEGLQRSQVMDTAFWLSDRYGPRLNGSPEFEEAGNWAIERLRGWGISNLHKERFMSGRGWSLERFSATMTAPRVMPIIGLPKAWSEPTAGPVTADVVRVTINNAAEAVKYRGQLKGKIVLAQPARAVRMLEHGDGTVLRYSDQDGKWLKEAMTTPTASWEVMGVGGGSSFDAMQFYRAEGVVAIFDRGPDSDLSSGGSNLTWRQQRPDGGTIVLDDRAVPGGVPQVTLAVEHYNRMLRLLEHGVPVSVELEIGARFTDETQPRGFNIVGEIPGTDKADEVVLIGAHFDSWHGATGATDNAAGAAAMMEAMRIIKASGLVPRRTIRLGLWGSEENGDWRGVEDAGLLGSRTYALEHLGSADQPRLEGPKTSLYLNLDNGTGRIRGVWTQGNAAAGAIFNAWSLPLRDLGVDIISPRRVTQTDHVAFDTAGIPAFQFVQERYEYNARTHHTNMDFYDRLQPEDLKQVATVTAVFAWHAATRAELFPRVSAAPRSTR